MATRSRLQSLQESRRHGIGRLLLLARRDFIARLSRSMGGDEAIVQARGRVLPYLDIEGTRSVDLARRMGMTKQAVARQVRELEEEGLIYRKPDGSDGRAELLVFTPEGLEYLKRLHKCIARIERDYETLVGKDNMHIVREALSSIAYLGEKA